MNENDPRQINDADRRLAESKKLTLNPLHNRVVTDDVPDEQIATNHLVSPPIPNAPNDTEQDSQPIQPAPGTSTTSVEKTRISLWQRSAASLVMLAIFVIGGIITGAVFLLVQ